MFLHQNHGAGGGNGSVMVGMFVCLCLASKKPSEREIFVSARTELAIKLLKQYPRSTLKIPPHHDNDNATIPPIPNLPSLLAIDGQRYRDGVPQQPPQPAQRHHHNLASMWDVRSTKYDVFV